MSDLFGRVWRLTVGTLQTENLDCKFEVHRSIRGIPNTATLDIYNLSKAHRDEISASHRPLVRIEAGYVDSVSMLFQGNARRRHSVRDGVDWITHIAAGDGENAIRTARASRSFGPNATLRDVVLYLADAMGVGRGNVSSALEGAQLDQIGSAFPHGTIVRGNAARELEELLRSAGLTWSVQDGALQVLQRNGVLQRDAIQLSAEHGLIGVPEVGTNHVLKLLALLQPDLVPGRVVQVQSDAVNGVYRIESAIYKGETRGDDWQAELTTRERP